MEPAATSPTVPPPRTAREHMPQLDSLRTFAVGAILLHHWVPDRFRSLPLGSGVHLFFVLSGFLITGLLLDARVQYETNQQSGIWYTLRAFYARRFLRIFPLYYAALGVATYFDVAGLQQTWPWHAAYLSNYHILLRNEWIGLVGHFWTLAVEEQFYLFWPMVVLGLPRRHLPVAFVVTIVGAVLFRLVGAVFFPHRLMWDLATPGYLDSFALGALFAFHRRWPGAILSVLRSRRLAAALIALCVGLFIARKYVLPVGPGTSLDPLFLSVAFALLVHLAAEGITGPVGWVLDRPLLRYLGKISYGIYVIHNFAPIPVFAASAGFPLLSSRPAKLLAMGVFTVGLSMLSWHLYESRINALKRHFPYTRRPG
jgi:peptidoglycan/LPS O-acetylase OafA/YrhL